MDLIQKMVMKRRTDFQVVIVVLEIPAEAMVVEVEVEETLPRKV